MKTSSLTHRGKFLCRPPYCFSRREVMDGSPRRQFSTSSQRFTLELDFPCRFSTMPAPLNVWKSSYGFRGSCGRIGKWYSAMIMPRRVLISDYAWKDLEIERATLARGGANLLVAETGSEDELTALAPEADGILTCWKA